MSITQFIKKVCTQDAVYWEYDGPDGYGGSEFKSPTEIKVRWDEEVRVATNENGEEVVSHAQILTPNDLAEQSWLYLGTLSELPNNPDPQSTEDAYEIKAMERHPLFMSKTMDVFIAHLDDNS